MAAIDHWSSTPRLACNAIIEALQTNMSTIAKSVKRIASDSNLQLIKLGLHAGTPGVLLYYGGGPLGEANTMQQQHGHTMNFRLLCCSSNFESRELRQSGAGEMDIDEATTPGVEELQDWAYRIALRALDNVDGVCMVRAIRMNPATFVEKGLYIGTVDLTAHREIDIYDDAGTATFEALGFVFNPNDADNIWANPPTDTTPDSEWPGYLGGGAEYTPEEP